MKKLSKLTAIGAILAAPLAANAAPTVYFGEDLDWFSNNNSTNADAAQASFLSNLVGAGVEDLESFAVGASAPLNVNFGAAGSATLNGGGIVTDANVGGGAERRAFSGSNFWETSSGSNFQIDFTEEIAAFGFYGIDFGDFNGQIQLTTSGGEVFEVPHSQGSQANGSLAYWGVIDTENTFTSIAFTNTGSGADFFGFDDFTIGTVEQVQPPTAVAEPSSLILAGLGLIGVGVARRQKK